MNMDFLWKGRELLSEKYANRIKTDRLVDFTSEIRVLFVLKSYTELNLNMSKKHLH